MNQKKSSSADVVPIRPEGKGASAAEDKGPSGKQARRRAQRKYKALSLSRLVPQVLKDGLGRKGSLEADLLLHWVEVVGAEHAAWTVPTKISYADRKLRRRGTLELAVHPAYAAFAQMAEAEIIAAVNQFLGHGRVERVQIKQSAGQQAAIARRTVTKRAGQTRTLHLEDRRERRQNTDLDKALESLEQSIEQRDKGC